MTVREVAAFAEKEERTVQRWVKKAADKMSSVADKMSSAGSGCVGRGLRRDSIEKKR